MHLVTECTGLLGMGAFIIGKVLSRLFMTGKTGSLYIIGKIERQWFMGIGMAGKQSRQVTAVWCMPPLLAIVAGASW